MIQLHRSYVIFCLLSAPFLHCWSYQFFVSTTGSDSNPGTIDQPFLTITKAVSLLQPGDTAYVRGGVYAYSATISISKNGTDTARYRLLAYPGERPVLDFSSMLVSTSNRGIRLSGSYWHIKGFDVKGAGDNGMHVGGSYNIIEFCSFYENRDTGLQLGGGASHNQIVNCDSYYNADPDQEDADGFAAKLDVGTDNSFYGCRSWENCDDGFDGYLRPVDNVTTTLERCWIFKNGYLKDGSPSIPNGDGNGFKMGGGDNGNVDSLRHNITLKNCLAFDNRSKGFDQNNNRGSMTLLNCTAYRNGTNYGMGAGVKSGQTMVLTNCVALGSVGSIWGGAVQKTNGWVPGFSTTNSDFVSIDTTGVRGPRKADGSLPDISFLHLASGSDLIDAGTDVGLPFSGSAPDLGAFETSQSTDVFSDMQVAMPASHELLQNYPNPFNPKTTVGYQLAASSFVTLKVFDVLGREVATLVEDTKTAGNHTATWNGQDAGGKQLPSGIYFYRLIAPGFNVSKTMVMLK